MNYKAFFAVQKDMEREGLTVKREDLIKEFTANRATNLTQLSPHDFGRFVNWVKGEKLMLTREKNNTMRRKIIAMFHKMGYAVNGSIDMDAVNGWAESHGHLRKPLNKYVGNDLVKLVTQAENYYKSHIQRL